jgi:hypothetical protein
MSDVRDVTHLVPPTWSEYIIANQHRGSEWEEDAYRRATEKMREWAEQNYHSLRPGVQEQVRLCFNLLGYPILREDAMNRLIWIKSKTT